MARQTQNNRQITISNNVELSTNSTFNQALNNLNQTLIQSARSAVETQLGSDIAEYTELELRSMVMVEALKMTNGMDLATIMTRGAVLNQIVEEGLVSVHPAQYQTLEQMAQDNGISVSEMSDTISLTRTIFPYIQNELGLEIRQLWASVGKAVFRDMTPVLKALISGEEPRVTSVRASVERILNQSAANLMAQNELTQDQLGTPEAVRAIRHRAISDLVNLGATSTARVVRNTIRPERTPAISALIVGRFDEENVLQETGVAVFRIETQDQLRMLRNLMKDNIISTTINTATAGNARVNEYLRTTLGALG